MGGLGVKNIWLEIVPAVEEGPFPPEAKRSCADCILLLLVTVFVPGEAFLIEGYDYLWALMIGLPGKHKISLLRVFPARAKKNNKKNKQKKKFVFKSSSEVWISAVFYQCFLTDGFLGTVY